MTDTKKILNITMLGTLQHAEKINNALTANHDLIEKEGKHIALLLPGIGSAPATVDSTYPTPGTYCLEDDGSLRKTVNTKTPWLTQLLGITVGKGQEDLIRDTVAYMESIRKENGGVLPEIVNMQGFSRGADTCIRTANILNLLYPDITVNLFLIDPVPGPLHFDDPDSYTIPQNVKRVETFFMIDDKIPVLKPQEPDRYVIENPLETRLSVNLLHGQHSSATNVLEGEEEAAILLRNSLMKFCIDTGSLDETSDLPIAYARDKKKGTFTRTEKVPPKLLSAKQEFKLFDDMKKKAEQRKAYQQKGVSRTLRDNRERYVQDPYLFVSQRHRELFRELYPAIFNWFFEKNANASAVLTRVDVELSSLKEDAPYIYKQFMLHYKIDLNAGLPPPQGVARIQEPTLGKPLVRDRLSYLQHNLKAIANHYQYHINHDKHQSLISFILKGVERSKALEESKAIYLLEGIIEKIKKEAEETNNKSFVVNKIKLMMPNADIYAKSALKLLDRYFSQSSSDDEELIKDAKTSINQINSSTADQFVKYHEIKEVLIHLNTKLQENETTLSDRALGQRVMQVGLFGVRKPSKHELIKKLNELSHPPLSELSLCSNIIRSLDAYERRTTILFFIRKFLSEKLGLPISLPRHYKEQQGVMNWFRSELQKLEKQQAGNDVYNISKACEEANQSLTEVFTEKKETRKGELSKILIRVSSNLASIRSLSLTPPKQQLSVQPSDEELSTSNNPAF